MNEFELTDLTVEEELEINDLQIEEELEIGEIEPDVVYENNHAHLNNLDYEHSGHTGFQKSEEGKGLSTNDFDNEYKNKLDNSAGLKTDDGGEIFNILPPQEGEDYTNIANGQYSHAEGKSTSAYGVGSHAEGSGTIAGDIDNPTDNSFAHAEGEVTVASGRGSHAEGSRSIASGIYSHAEGSGDSTEDTYSIASGDCSHSEGYGTTASGNYSHSSGFKTEAAGGSSIATGHLSKATELYSNASGYNTRATGRASTSGGIGTVASGRGSFAQNLGCKAIGDGSSAFGRNTQAIAPNQFVIGEHNTPINNAPFVVGDGTDEDNTHNLLELLSNGTLVVNKVQGESSRAVCDAEGVLLTGREKISNKVTHLSIAVTDESYPSAKCVYDELQLRVPKDEAEVNNMISILSTGDASVRRNSVPYIRQTASGIMILSAENNFIYIRPNGHYSTENQVSISKLGNVKAPSFQGRLNGNATGLDGLTVDISDLNTINSKIDNTVNDLVNYYLKSDTYTKSEVNNLIGQIQTVTIQVVQALPEIGQSNIIYFVPKDGSVNDIYDEWIWVNNSWEHIGNTEVDLSDYYTKSEINNQMNSKANNSDIPTELSQLTDDLGSNPTHTHSQYLTEHQDLSEYAKTTDLPTKTSDLTNDSNFITSSVSNLSNYYDKTYIDNTVGNIESLLSEV